MYQSLTILLLVSFTLLESASIESQYNPCNIYGVIYIEDNPLKAHFKVFEETSEAFADVIIYIEKNRLYTDTEGKWYFTETREFADFFIYFEEKRELADFSIYYTDYESFSGCNN